MKKIIGILAFLIYPTCMWAQVYVVSNDAVYYYEKVIVGADANSFEVLYDNQLFSKDKNNIYYKGKKSNYDAETFEIHINNRFGVEYLSDKNNVYVSIDDDFIGIGSQSPKRFYLLNEDLGIDEETIYWEFNRISGSDAPSIQLLSTYIFKDKNKVYNEEYSMPLNPNDLKLIKKSKGYDSYLMEFIGDRNMICDDNNYCFQMDINSFEYINFNYTKDNNHVLYRNNYLKADVKTFEVPISDMEHYAKDRFHQYYLGNVFPVKVDEKHIKPDSLNAYKNWIEKQLEEAFAGKVIPKYDKDSKASLSTIYAFPNSKNTIIEKGGDIYMNGERQTFIDASSFEIFNNDYAKDNNQVYLIYEYEDKVTFNPINGIDANTFSIIENDYDSYCRDAKNVYHRTSRLKDADPSTFKVMGKGYAEDKNSIFLTADGDKLHTIKPMEGVRLKWIEGSYFSFGDKIFYLDAGRESFVENPNFADFKVLDGFYALNGKQVIYKGRTAGILAAGESIVTEDDEKLVTSENRVFLYGQEMNSLKKNGIYKYGTTNYVTDGHTLYFDDAFEVKGVDLENMHHSSAYINYFTFKNNKALYENVVFDIDLETFEEVRGMFYARDKNYVYYKGEKTKLDASTFFQYESDFTSDKNGVYFYNKLIPGADTESFHVFEEYGFDDHYFYHDNRKIPRSKVNLKK